MIDVIRGAPALAEIEQVLDDADDILPRQSGGIGRDRQVELFVEAVAADIAEIVALGIEEEALDELAGGIKVRGLAGTEVLVDGLQRLVLGMGLVLQKGVTDDLRSKDLVAADQLQFIDTGVDQLLQFLRSQFVELVDDDLAGLAVDNVLDHAHARQFLDILRSDLGLIDEVEGREDIAIRGDADGAQQGGDQELFAAVDIDDHHLVDIGCELHPGAAQGDDTRGVEPGPVGMGDFVEKDAGRAVELADDDALGAVDDKSAAIGHKGDEPQIDHLFLGIGQGVIGVVLVLDGQTEFGLEGYRVGHPPLLTLLNAVLGRVDVVLDKVEDEIFPAVDDRKDALENRLQADIPPLIWRYIGLEKVPE